MAQGETDRPVMTGARAEILNRIRAATGEKRATDPKARPPGGLGDHPIPARARLRQAEIPDRFATLACEAAATLTRVASPAQAPRAVSDYLRAEGLAADIVVAADPLLARIPWAQEARLTIRQGVTGPHDLDGDPVVLTGAVAGIAETGTVMVRSGPRSPNMLYFLAETHIVVLEAGRLVGSYEDAFAILDRDRTSAGETTLPRAVTLITGPSRTGDIERELVIGVHGPRRLHIVLIDGEET